MCNSFVCEFKVNRICTCKDAYFAEICKKAFTEICKINSCQNCRLSTQCSLCNPTNKEKQNIQQKENPIAASYSPIKEESRGKKPKTKQREDISLSRKKKAYAFVDGSYNKYTKVYGYGGYLIDESGVKHLLQGNGSDPEMSSMRNVSGEILGAEAAMRKAEQLGISELDIYYDYTGIEAWVTGKWHANKEGTQRYRDIMRNSRLKINFVKVKGHSGVDGNEEADRLAKKAVGISA